MVTFKIAELNHHFFYSLTNFMDDNSMFVELDYLLACCKRGSEILCYIKLLLHYLTILNSITLSVLTGVIIAIKYYKKFYDRK